MIVKTLGIEIFPVTSYWSIMEIKIIKQDFSVCKVKDYSFVNFNTEYCFIGKTDEEKSLVCITSDVPSNVTHRDDGWKGFRLQGILDFSLIGILSPHASSQQSIT